MSSGSDRDGESAQVELILAGALSHPLRRQILRSLREHQGPLSTAELRRDWIGGTISNLAHHVKVLRELGAIQATDTRHVRGATETFHRSLVAEHYLIVLFLDRSEKGDENYRKKRRKRPL